MTEGAAQLDMAGLEATVRSATELLLSKRNARGHWEGSLSSSALSTATAVFAIARVGGDQGKELVRHGLEWLCANQNADGGWGDTVKSFSNLSTTALCYAALGVGDDEASRAARAKASQWISRVIANRDTDAAIAPAPGEGLPFGAVRRGETFDPALFVRALAARYGKDRTFAVPILSMLAIAGELGPDGWQRVMPLPFELATLPHGLFRFLRLQVVSYALPALIAVGQARFHQAPPAGLGRWALRWWRGRAVGPTLRLLEKIQPESGGFLEAAPLTSFVLMNLSAGPGGPHAARVIARGLEFLRNTVRPDGSWPIDTNLATWVTTLAVNALTLTPDPPRRGGVGAPPQTPEFSALRLPAERTDDAAGYASPTGVRRTPDIGPPVLTAGSQKATNFGVWGRAPGPAVGGLPLGCPVLVPGASCPNGPVDLTGVLDWLLSQQHRREHPYTHAAPGGWAWTDLSGGVPDADDTAGALLAIKTLCPEAKHGDAIIPVVRAGVEWLLNLQNSDGGIPTFCRGWGKLPFDRSSFDLTAHAMRAWFAWAADMPEELAGRVWAAFACGKRFLARRHREGFWEPLWFGSQHAPGETNSVYGTAKVLQALSLDLDCTSHLLANKAIKYLLSAQNPDGGWGGAPGSPSSIEETAVAVEAMSCTDAANKQADLVRAAVVRGVGYLIHATHGGTRFDASPIGLYFAKLWYFEELYPLIFTVAALNRVRVFLAAKPASAESIE